MPKTGGEITREKILRVSEKLFSEKGFDGTGIEEIAKKSGINKATIYYHFKNKNEIIATLSQNIIDEVDKYVELSASDAGNNNDTIINEIKEEINFLKSKKDLLSLIVMESLKSRNSGDFLLKCAEKVIINEYEGGIAGINKLSKTEKQKYFIHEFFTGFMPIVAFVLFRKKYCDYLGCDDKALLKNFLESFGKTHLSPGKMS